MRRKIKTIFEDKLRTLSLPVLDFYRERFLQDSLFLIRLKLGKDKFYTIREFPSSAFTLAWSRYLYLLDWYTSFVVSSSPGVETIKLQFVYVLREKKEFYKYVFHSVKLCVQVPFELKTLPLDSSHLLTKMERFLQPRPVSVLRKNLYKFHVEDV